MASAQPWGYWLMPPRLASQARVAKSAKVFGEAFGVVDRGFDYRLSRHDAAGSLAHVLESAVEALWPAWSGLSPKPMQFAWCESDAVVQLDVSNSELGEVQFLVSSSGPGRMSMDKVCSGSLSECAKAFEAECRFYDDMESDEEF